MKEYTLEDEVKISCNDCLGCQKCCEHMGDSILLDPYDMWLITSNLKLAGGAPVTYDTLVSEDGPFELTNSNHIILPSMKMVEPGQCPFLNDKGRCSIHRIRPGLCRLYPLGRNYYEDHISYFILDETLGCPAQNKEPVLIKDWIGVTDIQKYEAFVFDFHKIRATLGQAIKEGISTGSMSMEQASLLISRFLAHFYVVRYEKDFFFEFEKRKEDWEKMF